MLENLMNCILKAISDDIFSGSLDLIIEISELMAMLKRQERIEESPTTYL